MHRFAILGSTLVTLAAAALLAGAGLGLAAMLAPPALAAPFTSPDGLWTWSRPLPHGYPADSISSPVPGELFVASSVGDVLVTRDGGASWAWSRTSMVPGFAAPQGVQFVSPTEGWAWGADTSGKNGMLLHTTDAGATWQSSLTVPGQPTLQAHFADPSRGWVLAGDPADYGDCVLSTTADGGQTWSTPAALPPDQSDEASVGAFAPQGGARAVLMVNDWSIANVDGGTKIWRTTDGGATWLAPIWLKGIHLFDASFSSPSVGWATSPNWLWATTDGGAHWRKVHKTPGNGHLTTVGNNVWVTSLLSSTTLPGGTLHSADGGKTWQWLPGLSGSLITFSDPQDGWIAGHASYRRTTDGGKSWQRLTSTAAGVTKLAAVPGGTVWGAAGRVIKSPDGGRSWAYASKRNVGALAAVSALQAWAVGAKGLVMHTTDGGRHWAVQSSGVVVNLHDVCFVDAKHGWAAGDNGTLLRTTDGGRHWSHIRVAGGGALSELSFADAGHGIALDWPRGILATSDGGRTWSATHLPISTDVPYAAIMLDASHALIIAFSRVTIDPATAWTSADGGKTWLRGADLPNDDYYESIARSGAQLCAVGSQQGNVVTSRDGGATWTSDGVPSGGSLTSVQFVGSDTLMIGGNLGVLTRDLTTAPLP